MKEEYISLGHGGGGGLTRDLIANEISSRFTDPALKGLPDGAQLKVKSENLAFSTDSFVVQPLFFPGGNIGHLAVHGTVNDIAACGARPRWLSLALILEEGVPISTLRAVLDSIRDTAKECNISVVTGDTKVVARGQCDEIFINTSGIGELLPGFHMARERLIEGDKVLVSGTLGDHGMAVMSARENLQLKNGPTSDTASVFPLIEALGHINSEIKLLRDPTRGGAAAVLNEWVEGAEIGLSVNEGSLPFANNTRAVAEMLGIDLLHVASEGRIMAICSEEAAAKALSIWQSIPGGERATIIGSVSNKKGKVILETLSGGRRLIDLPRGELLPRIC